MLQALRSITDRNVRLVYGAIFLLGLGYGIAIAVIAIYLDMRAYSKEAIGYLAAWFAAGIVAFSLPMGGLIRRFSAKTTLATSLFGYAATAALLPWAASSIATLSAVRFADGAFSVGIWVSCETILLERSERDRKGLIMGFYAMAMGLGYVVGPVVARVLANFMQFKYLYWTAGAVASASAMLVLLRLDRAPPPLSDTSLAAAGAAPAGTVPEPTRLPALLWRIKTSCFATFVYGYWEASVVLFMPLFMVEFRAIPPEQTIVMPAFFAAGGLTFAGFSGRLGDRFGHLKMMRVLSFIGACLTALFVLLPSFWLMAGTVFLGGMSIASISPVSLALQGVVVPAHDYARANAIYNAFFAAGMLMGPPICSRIYAELGGGAMLFHVASLWAAFSLFALVFRRDDPAAVRRAR